MMQPRVLPRLYCKGNFFMWRRIIIWDNDGTIMGSKNPNDTTNAAKVLLPNVEEVMLQPGTFNIICSGCKTPESEMQNFDPEKIIEKFKRAMATLPVNIAAFSPAIGGVQCYVILKKLNDHAIEVRKAHEDSRYGHLIGQFKKPGVGMLVVIQDMIKELNIENDSTQTMMIGDTWHDEKAATACGITFVDASKIHTNKYQEDIPTLKRKE